MTNFNVQANKVSMVMREVAVSGLWWSSRLVGPTACRSVVPLFVGIPVPISHSDLVDTFTLCLSQCKIRNRTSLGLALKYPSFSGTILFGLMCYDQLGKYLANLIFIK
jgi:hypothetical protein